MPESTIEHAWDVEPAEARRIQAELASRVDTQTPLPAVRTVAGADISYDRGCDTLYAAVIVVDIATMGIVDQASLAMRVPFPYVPGLLSFREAPPILAAFRQLQIRPDALVTDGQGLAHPRRFGIACHLGLILDIPAIGCGKSRLCGDYVEPGIERGSWMPLTSQEEVIGAVFRSRRATRPLFVSVGHKATLPDALELIKHLTPKYRVPVPTRLAHVEVNRIRKQADQGRAKKLASPPPVDNQAASELG